jgi:hypothetical protein
MIKDREYWRNWEENGPLREPPDFERNLRIVEAMYALARTLGVWPPSDPLAGLDTKIRMARILNARRTVGPDR